MIKLFKKFCFSTYHLFVDYYYHYQDLNRRLETLEYIVRSQCPVTKLPKASGDMRLLQLGATALLKKINAILDTKGLKIWLDSGTLLGAIRHGGFIPWDDDVDVSAKRDDYYKIFHELQSTLPKELYSVTVSDCIRIIFKGTPCQIDIFPYDEVGFTENIRYDEVERFRDDLVKYNYETFEFDWNRLKIDSKVIVNKTDEEIAKCVSDYTAKYKGKCRYYAQGVEVRPGTFCMLPEKKIFPLQSVSFEGVTLLAPADADAYLRQEYGDYMAYPPSIHLHEDIQNRMTFEAMGKIKKLVAEQNIPLTEACACNTIG